MKRAVRVYGSETEYDFIDKLNNELGDIHDMGGELIDIKYSTCLSGGHGESVLIEMALVIYDDKE